MARVLSSNISTDCVIFSYGVDGLRVLLVERQYSAPQGTTPLIQDLKLPGGLVYNDELLKEAAQRILKELTGLEGISLKQFDVLDSLQRMNNNTDKLWLEHTSGLRVDRVISIAFYGLLKHDDKHAQSLKTGTRWVEVSKTEKLPFDHNEIILRALTDLRYRLKKEGTIFTLLPEKFAISELQEILALFYTEKRDSRNFRKKIKKFDYIIPLTEKQKNVAHKPARLYRFDKKKFQQFSNSKISF